MSRKKRKRNNEDEGNGRSAKKLLIDPALPEGVHHYESVSEVPWDTQHYWRQRHQIFSKYDEGIWMTDDAWFGVTQESVARRISEHVAAATPDGKAIILDAFCGAGGNTIAFALSGKWKRVYAIEKDFATLECARHNAKIYGVHDKITFFHGDCFEMLGLEDGRKEAAVPALQQVIGEYGVIFASPPWGGPGYKSDEVFDVNLMQPYGLDYMFESLSKVTKNLALYLPRTSDLRQLASCVEEGKKAQVVHYCTNGGSRALCAYLGDWKMLDT